MLFMNTHPATLVDAIRHYADADTALQTLVQLRWPNGVRCPHCDRDDVRFLANQRRWECKGKHPKRQFSAKIGTIFEDSPLGLDVWFTAIWMLANCKNGVSSYEIARAVGITQKSAWHVLHRVRLAMKTGTFMKLDGQIEADESFVGGKAVNMHKARREALGKGRGTKGKAVVMGVLRRTDEESPSTVRAKVIAGTRRHHVQREVCENVEPGSRLYTDALRSYDGLSASYDHKVIDHAVAYAEGLVHTNGIENFWSLLKRSLKGTYIAVDPRHLDSYLDEQAHRFNNRKLTDGMRFMSVLSSVTGRRLTYRELIEREATQDD